MLTVRATSGARGRPGCPHNTGMTEDEYRNIMIAGGRSAEGNRYIGEDGDAQAHRQPQGQAGKLAAAQNTKA